MQRQVPASGRQGDDDDEPTRPAVQAIGGDDYGRALVAPRGCSMACARGRWGDVSSTAGATLSMLIYEHVHNDEAASGVAR